MVETLHLCALALSATGTCCLVADRRRARALELAASMLMLVAMLDLLGGRPLLAPVVWAALLVGGAMTLAAVRRAQARAQPRNGVPKAGMTSHSALGMVVMAVLLLTMSAHSGSPGVMSMPAMSGMHGHVGPGAIVVLCTAGYLVASAVAVIREHTRRDRIQYGAMGCSTLVMALAVLVPPV